MRSNCASRRGRSGGFKRKAGRARPTARAPRLSSCAARANTVRVFLRPARLYRFMRSSRRRGAAHDPQGGHGLCPAFSSSATRCSWRWTGTTRRWRSSKSPHPGLMKLPPRDGSVRSGPGRLRQRHRISTDVARDLRGTPQPLRSGTTTPPSSSSACSSGSGPSRRRADRAQSPRQPAWPLRT